MPDQLPDSKKKVPVKPLKAWAVANERGQILLKTISNTENSARFMYTGEFYPRKQKPRWDAALAQGYRVVRVVVTGVEK